MATLYSDEVAKIIRLPDWPKGLIIEVVEKELFLQFILFRDNFETFDGEDKRHIAGLVGMTIKRIRDLGVPCYLEVAPGDGHGNSLDKNR